MNLSSDIHYSPQHVAEALADLIPKRPGMTVFDPAMGEGALLAAAEVRLRSNSRMVGADIDRSAVATLLRRSPHWVVGVADATSAASRRSSSAWREARRGVDAVVMNPPFSFRGYGGPVIRYEDEVFRATPAMAFVATVLFELTPRDGVFAVLPRGSVDGARDRELWTLISRRYERQIHHELPRGTFPGTAATSLIVSIRPRIEGTGLQVKSASHARSRLTCTCVEVVRGRTPVSVAAAAQSGLVPWVHTHELRNGRVGFRLTDLPRSLATSGPFITVPRVGRFDEGKVAVARRSSIILSDCVFALRAPTGNLEALLDEILAGKDALAAQYFGTGAPHITLERLLGFLASRGIRARHVKADAQPSECWCPRSDDKPGLVATQR